MKKVFHDLSSRKKAAIILMVIGPDLAAEVIKNFDPDTIELLSLEVARLEKVTPEQREQVIDEFHEMAIAQDYIAEGGLSNAKRVLETAFGSDRADEMVKKILTAMQVVPFEFLSRDRKSVV